MKLDESQGIMLSNRSKYDEHAAETQNKAINSEDWAGNMATGDC